MARQQLALARLHALGLFVLGVIPSEEMQDAVNDEKGDLVIKRDLMLYGVSRCDGGTEHHVTNELGNLRRGRLARPAASGVGYAPRGLRISVNGKT
jgi:hypothetical protein